MVWKYSFQKICAFHTNMNIWPCYEWVVGKPLIKSMDTNSHGLVGINNHFYSFNFQFKGVIDHKKKIVWNAQHVSSWQTNINISWYGIKFMYSNIFHTLGQSYLRIWSWAIQAGAWNTQLWNLIKKPILYWMWYLWNDIWFIDEGFHRETNTNPNFRSGRNKH